MFFRRLLLSSLAVTGAVSIAGQAGAQETTADQGGTNFGDIVVTAQKRDESLQDVPISVSAYTAEFREQSGIISTQDQMNFTPGVVYSQSADRVAIRGIGRQTNTVGTDPGVAVYNDGFYQPSLLDVGGSTLGTARVEVLRGPQGTLYGRNSIGGAINVISVRPSDEFEGEARLGLNDYGRVTLEGRVSGPLSDNARGSLMVYGHKQEDGYYDNLYPGRTDEGGVQDTWYAEGQIEFDVTDRLDWWMRLRVGEYDNHDRSGAMISPYDAGYSLENVPTPTYDLGPAQLNIPNPSIADNREFLSDRERSNYLDDFILFVTELNYRFDDFDVKYIGGFQQYESGYTVDGEQGPSDGFNWPLSRAWYPNIFSYIGVGELAPGDNSGVTIPIQGDVETFGNDDKDVFSHEINISSTGDGPLQWLVGAYYYQEQSEQYFDISFPTQPEFSNVYPFLTNPLVLASVGLPAQSIYGTAWAVMNGLVPPTSLPNTTRSGYYQFGVLEARSSAVFAQFDYDITDTLHTTVGVRYSHDEKEGIERTRVPAWYPFLIPAGTPLDVNGDTVVDFLAPADQIVNYVADISQLTFTNSAGALYSPVRTGVRDESFNHTTGTAGLQWTPNDDTLIYGTYSYGYKAGGFTLGTFKPTVDPETIDAFEIGWKQQIGDTLQFNGAIFFYNYHDLQTVIQTPVQGVATSQLINLNESRTRGIELEGIWAPTENFRLMANYSYNDAEILNACCFLDDADPFGVRTPSLGGTVGIPLYQDLAGNRVPFSPEHKAAINGVYSFFLDPGELSFSATGNYRSESYYTVFNTSDWLMEGYTTWDFRVRWQDANDRYSIIGTVANAFDEDAVQAFSTTNPQTSNQQTIGLQPPRIVSVEFQYRF